MRKALGVAAMVGLFLLLLSALVVASPQEGALTPRIEPPTVPPDAALAAMVLPDGTLATQANNGTQSVRMDVQLDAPPAAGESYASCKAGATPMAESSLRHGMCKACIRCFGRRRREDDSVRMKPNICKEKFKNGRMVDIP